MKDIEEREGKYLGFFIEFPTSMTNRSWSNPVFRLSTRKGRGKICGGHPSWGFDAVRQDTRSQWKEALERSRLKALPMYRNRSLPQPCITP